MSLTRVCSLSCATLLISCSPLTGQSIDYQRFAGGRGRGGGGRGGFGGATPSRVPEWSGGRTPSAAAAGGRTPGWGAASRSMHISSILPINICLRLYSACMVCRRPIRTHADVEARCHVWRPNTRIWRRWGTYSQSICGWQSYYLWRSWRCKFPLHSNPYDAVRGLSAENSIENTSLGPRGTYIVWQFYFGRFLRWIQNSLRRFWRLKDSCVQLRYKPWRLQDSCIYFFL